MNWKLTKVSFVFWVLYLMIVAGFLWLCSAAFGKQIGIQGNIIWAFYAGVLLIGGLFSVGIWFARTKWIPQMKGNPVVLGTLELIAFVSLLIGGILLRLQSLPAAQGGLLYELAEMKYQTPLAETSHMAENLYLSILHGFCYLLGNTPYYSLRFHLVLSVLAGTVWYLGVRDIAGRLPALIFAAFYFLDPYMVSKVTLLSAEPMVLFFYGIGLCCIGAFLRKSSGGWLGALLAGIPVGIACFTELFCVTLLALTLFGYNVERGEEERAPRRKIADIGVFFGGALVGFLACNGLWACFHLENGKYGFGTLFSSYFRSIPAPGLTDLQALFSLLASISGTGYAFAGAIFALFGIFGFFMQEKKEKLSPWVVILVLVGILMIFGMAVPARYLERTALGPELEGIYRFPFDGSVLLLLCMYVLAGIGVSAVLQPRVLIPEQTPLSRRMGKEPFSVRNMILALRRKKEERKAALDYAIAHPETMDGKNPITKFFFERARKKAENQREIDRVMYALNSLSDDHVVIEDFARAPHPEEAAREKEGGLFHLLHHEETSEKPEVKPEEKPEDKPRLLENPLPVPQKHVTSVLDYDYEVSDDDDYDLKDDDE